MTTTLYNTWYSPFGQRVWIALLEKGIPFTYEEIDPFNKTAEFLAMNPKGLIPVLQHNRRTIYESAILVEYVHEAWKDGIPLLPADPYERALVRIWCDFVSKKIVPPFYAIFVKETDEEREEGKAELLKNLETITEAMSSDEPYFRGKDFGMVDIMLLAHAVRLGALKHYRDFDLPKGGAFERFHKWYSACLTRDSVIKTTPSYERLIQNYEKYANNSAVSAVADAIRKGTALP